MREADGINDTSTIPALSLNISSLHQLPFTLNGKISDKGTNLDTTGHLFQTLQVTAPINVATSGVYSYSASLSSQDGRLLGTIQNQINLSSGISIPLVLNFDGKGIYNAAKNGPYVVKDLVFQSLNTHQVLFYLDSVGQTNSYQYTQFTAGPTQITVTTGTGQSASINYPFGTNLQTLVKDASGNPLSGAIVTFTAPISSASGNFCW